MAVITVLSIVVVTVAITMVVAAYGFIKLIKEEVTMELIGLVIVVVLILAYYGFMKSLETGAGMANKEVDYLADVHAVSLVERTARLGDRINTETMTKALEVKAQLAVSKYS